jgi:hypothetical protein
VVDWDPAVVRACRKLSLQVELAPWTTLMTPCLMTPAPMTLTLLTLIADPTTAKRSTE